MPIHVYPQRVTRTFGATGPGPSPPTAPLVYTYRVTRILGQSSQAAQIGTLREAIYERLNGSAQLTALVGARISLGKRTQGEGLPAVEYFIVGNRRGGVLHGQAGWAKARVQFNAVADFPAEAEAVAAVIENLFDAKKFTAAGVVVRWSKQIDDHDSHEFAGAGDDSSVFRVICDYRLTYQARSAE